MPLTGNWRIKACQSGRSAGLPTALLAAATGATEIAGAGVDVTGLVAAGAAGAGADGLAAGAGAEWVVAVGRAVLTGGADGVGAEPPPPPLPGRNASMRKSVMAKPVCSSGASDKSGRLVMVI